MRVRRVRQNEADPLRRLRLRALADSPRELGPFLDEERAFPPSYWQAIADDTQAATRRVSLVAEADQTLVGMVGGDYDAEARRVHLVALWVDPSRRGDGVGAALVDAVVSWAREQKADRVELWVADGAERAHELYVARGFVETGVHQPVPYAPHQMEKLLVRRL